jgi:methylamine dehydrogenase accessory protein MauD
MHTFLMISTLALWIVALTVGFLLLGTLRTMGLLQWKVDQLEATRPPRGNRSGLKPGAKAPAFSLPDVEGEEVSLTDFSGRRTLLVFVQSGCGPCHDIVPELNRLQQSGQLQVLVINSAEPEEARDWVQETHADFPVLIQDRWEVSKQYQVFATPFAFLINERGMIAAAGIVSSKQYLGYLLEAADAFQESAPTQSTPENATPDKPESELEAELSVS